MADPEPGRSGVLIQRSCRYCGRPMSFSASLCPRCRKHQNKWLEWVNIGAQLATVAAAITSFCLLGLTYIARKDANATLRIAERSASDLNTLRKAGQEDRQRIADLLTSAETTSTRLAKVEGVLTQVDLPSGGRKVCLISVAPVWDNPNETTTLYVPAAWTWRACRDQAAVFSEQSKTSHPRTTFRLGCVFNEAASIAKSAEASASTQPALPQRNCGW
jgi:hypothetical protein